jgi:hypothetical protein
MFALLLALLATTGAVTPAAPSLDGSALYQRAMAAMHDIQQPPFLQYRYDLTLEHKSKEKRQAYQVLERTSDHRARFVALNSDGSPRQDISVGATLLPPGAFLEAIASDVNPEGEPGAASPAPATIARVFASAYDVTLVGREAAIGCPNAYRLALSPKTGFDPHKHLLRELWLNADSYAICSATVLERVSIISKEDVLVSVDVNAAGYVTRWSLSGTGHLVVGTYALTAVGTYAGIEAVQNADPKMFR